MKNTLLAFLACFLVSCNNKNEQTDSALNGSDHTNSIEVNVEEELQSIEETRTAFQQAIKENRFGDLRKHATNDIMSLTPDCGEWEAFKTIRENPTGEFHYDSLVMIPKETIIVSDSVAYDFGTSSTYYTNENGEAIELTATFLAILKKDRNDGKWKLHREVANTRNLE
jgi:ketosteroid isomerase-like protein